MQLFARYPFLLRRLRRVLQLAVPAAVAADTARSCVVTYQLAVLRFEEWEQEDNADTQREVRQLLARVVQRCAAADPDFWPAALAPGGAAASSAASSGAADAPAAGDIWQLMGLDGRGAAASAATQPPDAPAREAEQTTRVQAAAAAAFAEAEAAELCRFQQREAAAAAAPRRAKVVVVTLNDALAHVASSVTSLELPWSTLMAPPPGVVRVTLSDVVEILGDTPPARTVASGRQRLQSRILAAADATAASMRKSLPWPQLQLSRKSALRYAVDWRGWPEPEPEPLERDLTCL